MLIKKLGQTRAILLECLNDLSDEQLNHKPGNKEWSISQVLYHLYIVEKETADLMLQSLKTPNKKVGNKDLTFILDRSKKKKATSQPPETFFAKKKLLQLLEESRFQYLQALFNEVHEKTLAEKSTVHPIFGEVSFESLTDYICLHEQRHIKQIKEIKQKVGIYSK